MAEMSLDRDLLDPTIDLPPHLQAVYDQMSRQNGGRNSRPQQYKVLAVQGKSPSDVMALSYNEQEKRDTEAMAPPQRTDIRRDPNFFMDAHTMDIPGVPQSAQHFGSMTDPMTGQSTWNPDESQGYDTRGDQQGPFFLGGLAGPTMSTGAPQSAGTRDTSVPIVEPSQIGSQRLQDIQDKISQFLSKPQAGFTPSPMPALDSPSAILTGLAMLFAPPNQSGNIILALARNQDAIRMRNDVLAKLHAETQNEQDKQQLEALFKQAAMEETRSYHQAQLNQQADITNANNSTKLQLQDARTELAKMSDETKRHIAGLKTPTEKVKELIAMGYDPAVAREMANSADLARLASRDLSVSRKLTEDTLRPLKEANMRSLTEYRNTLKDYLPDRIAAQFAGILLADERLRQQFEMFRMGLDQKTWEIAAKEVEGTVSEAQQAYDKMVEESGKTSTKRAEELSEARSQSKAIGSLVLDKDGNIKPDAEPKDVANYRYWLDRVTSLSQEDDSNTEEALRQAKATLEFAKERLKGIKAQRPTFSVSPPPSGQSILDKAKGMLRGGKGKRPPPMGGNVPVDPMQIDPDLAKRIKGEANPYLEGLV